MTGRSPQAGRAFVPSASSQQVVSPVPASIPNAEAIAYALRDDGPQYVLGAAFWCAFIDPMRTKWDQPYPCHFLAFLHNGLVKPHEGQGAKLTPLGEAVRDIMAKTRAQAIETRSDTTENTGVARKGESAVAKPCAQEPPSSTQGRE